MSASVRRQTVILVAEPELLLRFLVAEFLRTAGYHVIEVGDVSEMASIFRAGIPVDLIFCNVYFCVKNNLDILRWLSNRHPDVRILLTSTCGGAAAAQTLAIEFIPKPYRVADLALRIGLLSTRDPEDEFDEADRQAGNTGEIIEIVGPLVDAVLMKIVDTEATPAEVLEAFTLNDRG